MEVRKGYKQTEIGVIPEDWEVKNLENITISMVQGVNTAIDIPEYVVDGIPMLKANDIIDGNINLDNADKISVKTFSNYTERFKIKKNDFLLSNIGARLGSGSLYDLEVESSYAWNVMRITPNLKLISPLFLSLSINSPSFNKLILSNQMGSGMGFVPKNVLKKLYITLPPLKEQTAIAIALSDTDAWINSLEQLLTKKRQIKQGAMQELLKPKEGWEVKKLGEIVDFKNGVAHENSVDKNGKYIIVNSKFISQDGNVVKHSNLNLCPLYRGEITMVMSDIPNGKALAKCYIIENDNLYTLNQRICAFKAKEGFDEKFIYYKINRNEYYLSFDSGSGQTNLRKEEVLNCPIVLPKTKEEQTRIATILSDMDDEIAQLETKLAKAKQIKQGMMQELLTGRIRLV